MNKRYFFPLHFDGGNRGCEGIAKGTARILGKNPKELIGYCRDIELDTRLGLDKYITLQPTAKLTFFDRLERKVEGLYTKLSKTDLHFKYEYRNFLSQISSNDIMISTGGDMLCYNNNMVNTTNNLLSKRGIKTVLWGCSMGEKNYTPEKHQTLQNFNLIYCRESLTFEYFKSLGLKNIFCLPDPAFVLEPEETSLPIVFSEEEVIGLNLSPFVMSESFETPGFTKHVIELIKYILETTNYRVLLIPHVLWAKQDDRVVSNKIIEYFDHNKRISLLDSNSLNYLQIRYIISKCKYFIGGRTHSVISAYSTCVPSIAIGYSVKAIGIAQDLGLDSKLVVDSKDVNSMNNHLIESFEYLLSEGDSIRSSLQIQMMEYKNRPFQINKFIEKI